MIRLISILVFAFLLPAFMYAQPAVCGVKTDTFTSAQKRLVQAYFQQTKSIDYRSNSVDTVLLTIHLVQASGANSPGISSQEVEAAVDKANLFFGSAGLYFSICGSPRLINGAFAYNVSSAAELNRANYVANTINIYFVDEIFTSNIDQSPLGFAYLPYFSKIEDRIVVMAKSATNDGGVFIHELGHFYGLYHTHESGFGLELVDGSNCEESGDLLCDTPADPNLLIPGSMAGCSYVGSFVDPNGDLYRPPSTNFMSYTTPSCMRQFTNQQKNLIRSIHQTENSYLASNCDFYPDFAITTDLEDQTITSIQDVLVNYDFTNVGLEKDYEVNFKVTLFDDAERTVGVLLHEQTVLLSQLNENTNLFLSLDIPEWKTIGEYFLVAEIDADSEVIEQTERNNLSTTKITINNEQFEDLSLFPNPAQEELFVFFRDRQINGAFTVRIFRYDGVEVLADQGNKIGEEFLRKLDVSALNRGLYLALIDFEQRNFTKTFKFYKH